MGKYIRDKGLRSSDYIWNKCDSFTQRSEYILYRSVVSPVLAFSYTLMLVSVVAQIRYETSVTRGMNPVGDGRETAAETTAWEKLRQEHILSCLQESVMPAGLFQAHRFCFCTREFPPISLYYCTAIPRVVSPCSFTLVVVACIYVYVYKYMHVYIYICIYIRIQSKCFGTPGVKD